jgi:hypothetical protein
MAPFQRFYQRKSLLILIGLLLVGGAGGCAIEGAVEEMEEVIEEEPMDAEPSPALTATPGPTSQVVEGPPTIKEDRQLILEWPQKIRKGDSGLISVILEMDQSGEVTPTVTIEGQESSGEPVQIPDLYDTHEVKTYAQLNIAGMEVRPDQQPQKPLQRGEKVSYHWTVYPEKEGVYQGTVTFQVQFMPEEGGKRSEIYLPEQFFQIEVDTILGMSGRMARTIGWFGTLLGTIISGEDIFNLIRRWVEGEKKRTI